MQMQAQGQGMVNCQFSCTWVALAFALVLRVNIAYVNASASKWSLTCLLSWKKTNCVSASHIPCVYDLLVNVACFYACICIFASHVCRVCDSLGQSDTNQENRQCFFSDDLVPYLCDGRRSFPTYKILQHVYRVFKWAKTNSRSQVMFLLQVNDDRDVEHPRNKIPQA